MATKYVNETAAGKSISAYVVLNKKGEYVATIKAHFSNGGTCLVNVFQTHEAYKACFRATHGLGVKAELGELESAAYKLFGFQHATAGGYGYDKFAAALSGMTIDGHTMSNHASSEGAPKPPKGRKTFPQNYKPKKGYSLANWTRISKATGYAIYRDEWIKRAYEALGIADESNDVKNERWDDVAEKAMELEKAWAASDDCEAGYSSCFRETGLKYLQALGYQVIQAM